MGGYGSETIQQRLQQIKAKDIMSRFAITTTRGTLLTEVAHLMSRFKISGVPVMGKNKEICGIITATDLFGVLDKITRDDSDTANPSKYYDIPVETIMSEKVYSITEDTSLYDMIKLMCQKNIHTLPVLSGAEIVGVVGRRDVLNAGYAAIRKQGDSKN